MAERDVRLSVDPIVFGPWNRRWDWTGDQEPCQQYDRVWGIRVRCSKYGPHAVHESPGGHTWVR